MKVEEMRYTGTIFLSDRVYIKRGSMIPQKEDEDTGTVRNAMDALDFTDGDEIEIIIRRKKK